MQATSNGPRHYPEDLEESVFARPVEGFNFLQWTVDGQTVETSTRYTFSLSQGDSAVRVAEFALASSIEQHQWKGLKVMQSDTALCLQSETPIHALRVIDQAGRTLPNWAGEGQREVKVPMTSYSAGIYYLHIQRSEDQGWYKVKR